MNNKENLNKAIELLKEIKLEEDYLQAKYSEQEAFLIVAMAGVCIPLVEQNYADFTDNNGFMPLYDEILEIADELLKDEDGEYQKFLRDKDQDDWFSRHHNTCMDWYFMDRSMELMKERMEGEESKANVCKLCHKDFYIGNNEKERISFTTKPYEGRESKDIYICKTCADKIYLQQAKSYTKGKK